MGMGWGTGDTAQRISPVTARAAELGMARLGPARLLPAGRCGAVRGGHGRREPIKGTAAAAPRFPRARLRPLPHPAPPPPMVLPGPPGMARSEEVHRLTENVYKVSPQQVPGAASRCFPVLGVL